MRHLVWPFLLVALWLVATPGQLPRAEGAGSKKPILVVWEVRPSYSWYTRYRFVLRERSWKAELTAGTNSARTTGELSEQEASAFVNSLSGSSALTSGGNRNLTDQAEYDLVIQAGGRHFEAHFYGHPTEKHSEFDGLMERGLPGQVLRQLQPRVTPLRGPG